MEINKLEDLVPYRERVKLLWDSEDFQPVAAFLSSLIREQMEVLMYVNRDGVGVQQLEQIALEKQVAAARAGAFNTILNLPLTIKSIEETLQKRKAWQESMGNAQESGDLVRGVSR
jgi:uncharacterized membrane protein YcjF (UPF0283 family)